MTKSDFTELLERPPREVYKLTGPAEHWLTTLNTGFWGLNPVYERGWKRLKRGDIFLLHSTATERISDLGVTKGVAGVATFAGKTEKDSLEWYAEIKDRKNGWPYLIHFGYVWWFGQVAQIADEPIREKMDREPRAVATDALRLSRGAITFNEMTTEVIVDGEVKRRVLIAAQRSIARVSNPAGFVPLIRPRGGEIRSYPGSDAVDGYSDEGQDRKSTSYPVTKPPRKVREPIESVPPTEVDTGSREAAASARRGQDEFSRMVRNNYDRQCCFPNCDVADDAYLVGAHIARWADNEEARGRVDNGLCLCLMHDRAFERGHFFIDANYRVRSSTERVAGSEWSREHVLPRVGSRIKEASVPPNPTYLAEHRARVEWGN